jgi:RNA polymerase sigma-70 factor (ECF subfamily)
MDDLDRSLARKARSGNRRALASLYERYRSRVFGYLVKEMRDRGTAEDVFQEVWMKVMQGIGSYDAARGPFRAWLFRVAANAAVDRQRRDAVRLGDELDAPVENGEGRRVDLLPSDGPDPERLSASHEAGVALGRRLGKLEARQRTAVLLRHQQGLAYAEIAHAMAIPEGTAKTLVHRGVAALRRAMSARERLS